MQPLLVLLALYLIAVLLVLPIWAVIKILGHDGDFASLQLRLREQEDELKKLRMAILSKTPASVLKPTEPHLPPAPTVAPVLSETEVPNLAQAASLAMDPEATTPEFRERYLRVFREAALPYLWPAQRATMKILPASLGDLSQAIGAALVALYSAKS